MPYIITIKPERPKYGFDGYSRTAVATLDEAREIALEAVRVSDYRGEWMLPHIRATNDLATNDGGTIGPLPDGTVIEVQPIDLHGWARENGLTVPAGPSDHIITRALVDTFNAR